ncbi:MAG TPA: universal stress protein [Gammaproteobacteria bacterium]|nr:universal stress protein [Gammaproteobacteria bacterium]
MVTTKSPAEARFALRRIVVAMDSSLHAQAAAEAAVILASRFKAVLEGLFVEDVNLINLAEHPLSRLVSFPSGEASSLDRRDLERHIKSECARAQRMLESMAARLHLRTTFRILRGRVESEIVTAASDADLLVVGFSGRGRLGRGRPGSVAMAAIERGPRSVLVYRTGVSSSGTPLVCFDGSDGGMKALDAATSLQREGSHEVRVVLVPSENVETNTLRERVDSLLSDRGLKAMLVECTHPTPQRLCQLAALSDTSGIVIAAENPILRGEGLRQMLAEAPCPILLVR